MILNLKKASFIVIVITIFVLAVYTGFMGLAFSILGMWTDEPVLMIGYASTFLITTSLIYLFIKKDWL